MSTTPSNHKPRWILTERKTVYGKSCVFIIEFYDATLPLQPIINFNCVKETEYPKGCFHKAWKTMVRYLTF